MTTWRRCCQVVVHETVVPMRGYLTLVLSCIVTCPCMVACACVCINAFICACVAHPLLAGITDLAAAAEDFRNAQLSTASTSQISASLDEAEYVRLLEIHLAVRKLASQGFSWKDFRGTSPTAQLLQGSTHKEQTELSSKILACEIKLKVS